MLHKPIIEEMKGDDVSLVVVSELSDYIICTIPRVNSLHNFLVRVSNLTNDEEENVSEEDSDDDAEDNAKDSEEGHTKLLLFVSLSMFYRNLNICQEKKEEEGKIFYLPL